MSDKQKFYEEKMHEKQLPNINGEFNRGMRNQSNDWFGNKLILDRPRTYFGESFMSVKAEDLKFNTKTVFEYIDNQIREFLKRLIELVPDSNLNLDNLQTFINRTYGHPSVNSHYGHSVRVYEDDGNTLTEGFHYDIYFVLPLSDRNDFLESAVVDGFSCDTIVFKLEFDERIHDSIISSRFFSLYFNGVMKEESHGKSIESRIDYNNDNMTLNSIITSENLFRVGKRVLEHTKDYNLLMKAKRLFEQ